MWPSLVAHFRDSIEWLPEEAKESLHSVLKEVPFTIVDYAYYVNLTLHWLTVFGSTGFVCDPLESPIYEYRCRRRGSAATGRVTRLVEAFFKIPVFPKIARIRVDQIYQIRDIPEIAEWRAYLRDRAELPSREGAWHEEGSGEFRALEEDLWERFMGLAYSKADQSSIRKRALRDTAFTLTGMVYPPLSALGFLGSAESFYQSFRKDPIVAFVGKVRNILL